VPAEIGIHEQNVDLAVVIKVGEPGHVVIDDGQLGVRCCPGAAAHESRSPLLAAHASTCSGE
jgi:hypothetical protein